MQQQQEPRSMEPPPAWEERWEQCWPLLLGHLSARDLFCLYLSSRSIMSRLDSTPGWWQQACQDCLCWPPQPTSTTPAPTQSPSRTINPTQTPAVPTDQQARHVLFAATALAHHVRHARSPPPATVQIPPWLPGQPGISRGFSRVDPATLDPPLALTPTQLSWLAYGSLSGHTSGVFISTCSSNPRSQQACAFLAAVVSNKTLVAELYIPRNTALPDRWIGILSPPYRHTNKNRSSSSTVKSRGCSAENGGTDSSSSSGGGCVGSGGASSSSGCSASGEPGLELWLSNSVQLHQPQKQQPAGVAAGGGRGNRGRRARHASAVGGAGGNRGSCWAGIYKLIMDCILDNASRCKAVRGTTVVPPGTPAAAAIEQHLAQLVAASGPVLDLRRLHWGAAAYAGMCEVAALQRREEREEERRLEELGWLGVQTDAAQTPCSLFTDLEQQQPQQQRVVPGQQRVVPGLFSDRYYSVSPVPDVALPIGSIPWGWEWQAAAFAALQSTLVDLHTDTFLAEEAAKAAAAAERRAMGQGGGAAAAVAVAAAADGDEGEMLAALVERLLAVAPQVQVLVLPVLLPSGRAAQRVPSIGGSRLSAPKLLCLNVPFLMAVRKHAWEHLPHLRHVLLMAGTPLPLPQLATAIPASIHQQQQVQQQQKQAVPNGAVGGLSGAGQGHAVVQGTFKLQELEQRWQQQLQVGQEAPVDHSQQQHAQQQQQQQQQQGQYLWEVEQQDQWFEQQVAQQRPWKQQQQQQQQQNGLANSSSNRSFFMNGCEDAGCGAGNGVQAVRNGVTGTMQEPALSRAAVDALHDMVLSCMDRSC